MKTYFFNFETTEMKEFRVEANNLTSALDDLIKKLLSDNEPFKVYRNYYCGSVKTIPANLFNKYFTGYSF